MPREASQVNRESSRKLRVISWNLAHRVGEAASSEAALIRDLGPDLALLQEANGRSIEALAKRAGLDWVRWSKPDGHPLRAGSGYLAAIAGRGAEPDWLSPRFDVPFPDRVTAARIYVGNTAIMAAAYHAPPGVSWGLEKAQQAVTFARWLAGQQGLVVLGADANTPLVDHPDFLRTRTHWHTGMTALKGAPGDDFLWGHTKVHSLNDALRVALADNPARFEAVRALRPAGPLDVSFMTRRRNGQPSTPWRFDSVWVSKEVVVVSVEYLYDRGLAAGSDHAVVLADLLVPQAQSSHATVSESAWAATLNRSSDSHSKPKATGQGQSVRDVQPRTAEPQAAMVASHRGLIVYTRRRNPEGDWILIKNPKVYGTRRNWATTETFGTEEAAREWAYKHGMTVSERERWLNTQ